MIVVNRNPAIYRTVMHIEFRRSYGRFFHSSIALRKMEESSE